MELLRSSSAPFVIAALLSILGWHIGTLTEEIRETRSVVYDVEDRGLNRKIAASVTNVSKSQMLERANFALVCEDLEPCLDYKSRDVVFYPPTATDSINLAGNDSILGFTIDLAAGGRIGVSATRKTGAKVHFVFFPKGLPLAEVQPIEDAAAPPSVPEDEADVEKDDETDTKDIYVLDSDTWRGWVVLNYFNIVLSSFFLMLVVLLLGIIALGPRRRESRRDEGSADDVDSATVAPASGDGT